MTFCLSLALSWRQQAIIVHKHLWTCRMFSQNRQQRKKKKKRSQCERMLTRCRRRCFHRDISKHFRMLNELEHVNFHCSSALCTVCIWYFIVHCAPWYCGNENLVETKRCETFIRMWKICACISYFWIKAFSIRDVWISDVHTCVLLFSLIASFDV